MALIRPIERQTVHQIQSGQVIVDLCSVVKELVENSLDAGATNIEIRFKNNGVDSIEVQDNGTGIQPEDYESIALKHYTSKLSSYTDLSTLSTFGFRGEALSSLCALSLLHVVTARVQDEPKGTRLEFETSGKLAKSSVVASQKGTTVVVESIFKNLPVRRRELEKNAKREYGKAITILNAYACVSTGVKFIVSNIVSKGKKMVVFSTNSNSSTRDNIANIFGSKTLAALIPLDLEFEMQSSSSVIRLNGDSESTKKIGLKGYISRPTFGEGRQTPDRQMFFVNSRPCLLPQVTKAFNEVYKMYNTHQAPFIFANINMDTSAYDVNVSPDKRTILLHDQSVLLENLKASLANLFEEQAHSVPQARSISQNLPPFRQLSISKQAPEEFLELDRTSVSSPSLPSKDGNKDEQPISRASSPQTRCRMDEVEESDLVEDVADDGTSQGRNDGAGDSNKSLLRGFEANTSTADPVEFEDVSESSRSFKRINSSGGAVTAAPSQAMREKIHSRLSLEEAGENSGNQEIRSIRPASSKQIIGIVQNAFDRMRPRRTLEEETIITFGPEPSDSPIASTSNKRKQPTESLTQPQKQAKVRKFGKNLASFAAPGSRERFETESSSEDGNELLNDSKLQDSPRSTGSGEISDPDEIANSEDEDEDEYSENDDTNGNDASDGNLSDVDAEEEQGRQNRRESPGSEAYSDEEYQGDDVEEQRRLAEDARVERLITDAETAPKAYSKDIAKRINNFKKPSTQRKNSVLNLSLSVSHSTAEIAQLSKSLETLLSPSLAMLESQPTVEAESPEEKLSLIISKSDFSKMTVVGQFNLGFILATRASSQHPSMSSDVFIIDQHASDEIYNFERLQRTTTVLSQRLVHPYQLELTAIEEELVADYRFALEANGFNVSLDTSGASPVGKRCRLLSLPMSRKVVFNPSDLEELLALIAESPPSTTAAAAATGTSSTSTSLSSSVSALPNVPRPSKVRRMFAMRACRSSIMIGKTLSRRQMEKVLGHMGEIEKPWNCPHGRPTMRHLFRLDDWQGWEEYGDQEKEVDWAAFANS